ncbi:hypothetical protein HMJ29_11520 [Hymenobacter taeanensis]|uniref:Uncharacterized protein n=1 Tax=Hymenobacter taeanensis TaxID=2735321 RepID=A0A6M6BIA8_9BACT|nr:MULTISPECIES: hypothetical protein [Hymenobacter]QJX47534.1 hypothetical protein HMJ29_11520 [Hymenobacter taeanensis]UOQ82981.1 hypothetical protein MUN83_09570 [Hymenobacter sp. 5414T-23]
MLLTHLHEAGFFQINWAASAPASGITYVRPSAQELVRVFIPVAGEGIEVYSGSLFESELRYRGPVHTQAELLRLVRNERRAM